MMINKRNSNGSLWLSTSLLMIFSLAFLFMQCRSSFDQKEKDIDASNPLFNLKKNIGVDFANVLTYTEEFNPYTYRNFYNGGGVAIGDVNNDGLEDIYFTGNMVDNKLYLNKGNWQFEDITDEAKVACSNVWSSGANFVDVNGDGLLDIYVCKAGPPGGSFRHNELFINNGDLTFSEQSKKYGLDIEGLSVQSAFFDYDQDGDLDCYLLNNSIRSVGGFDLRKDQRLKPSDQGNKFFENRHGTFVDVTSSMSIYSSEIGFGLGITLSDFNADGWTDIYISNDFFERDYLYINQGGKDFLESGETFFESFPMGAMGADAADLDNDLRPDLMVTEMLPGALDRKKTKAIFEPWNKYQLAIKKGYAHQMPRNMLQRNMGDDSFLELGRGAGVDASDWTWSCLIQDFDNDGLKDIFLTNGIGKDLLDRDYLAFVANESGIQNMIRSREGAIKKLIDTMPEKPIANVMLKNRGEFNFENVSETWGFEQPTFSNGAAYGDLDNDGDLDLVINNINDRAFIYENHTVKKNDHHWLSIQLKGMGKNSHAIGAKVEVFDDDQQYIQELYPSRGFQSSVSSRLHFGLGACDCDEFNVRITWPNQMVTFHENILTNRMHTFDENVIEKNQEKLIKAGFEFDEFSQFFTVDTVGIKHNAYPFNQFNRERLLIGMNPSVGPILTSTYLNRNTDFGLFVGGDKNNDALFYKLDLKRNNNIPSLFPSNKKAAVADAIFLDLDGDDDDDLYLAHGGSAFSPSAIDLHDQIFINDGRGNFTLKADAIDFDRPFSTGVVATGEVGERDLLPDLFIGERAGNLPYGTKGSGFIYKNNGDGQFSKMDALALEDLGMITDAAFLDLDNDGDDDLIVVGEWMGIRTFFQNDGQFLEEKMNCFDQTVGVWYDLKVEDLNGDGQKDLVIGNTGSNGVLNDQDVMFFYDFDQNGQPESILTVKENDRYYPVIDMDDLTSQFPQLKRKFVHYSEYSKMNMTQIFSPAIVEAAQKTGLDVTRTLYFQREGKTFVEHTLPKEVQYSSVHALECVDVNHDGMKDLIIGGNHYLIKPQFGRLDASKGWLLLNDVGNIGSFEKAISLQIDGEIRDIESVGNRIFVGRNNMRMLQLNLKEKESF